ncbi:hypothetical protein [Streptomyces sp. NPDC102462]|uniref:hypothetical protein n=1 Tax=Streptomyces sp. NPDC102462 TaxID=3366178 RepID=UPI003822EA00
MTGTTPTPADQLPLDGAALASDPRMLAAVRAIGTRHGIDYTDDDAVTALLTERRAALRSAERGPLVWLGALALVIALLLPFAASTASTQAAKASLAASGPLLVIAVAALVRVRDHWKQELRHPALAGYREVLGVARAHGLALAYAPGWLEGRRKDSAGAWSEKAVAPIPSYASVEPQAGTADGEALPHPAEGPSAVGPAAQVPAKSQAVTEYETIAGQGGWHDETGCLLVLAAGGGAVWGATSDTPAGYGALVLIPLAILVWLFGRRQGLEKERLRAEALSYVRAVRAAQAAGAPVPELSTPLRALLDD